MILLNYKSSKFFPEIVRGTMNTVKKIITKYFIAWPEIESEKVHYKPEYLEGYVRLLPVIIEEVKWSFDY